jgi:hypothetical protein
MHYGYKSPDLQIASINGDNPVFVFEKKEEALFATFRAAMDAEKKLAESSVHPFVLKDFHEWKKEQES